MEDVQINGNFKFQTIDFIIIAYIYSHEIKKYEIRNHQEITFILKIQLR